MRRLSLRIFCHIIGETAAAGRRNEESQIITEHLKKGGQDLNLVRIQSLGDLNGG